MPKTSQVRSRAAVSLRGVLIAVAAGLLGSAPSLSAEVTPAPPAAFTLEDPDACRGYYQYADYRFYQFADFPVVARVYQEGSRWFVQDTGQDPVELIPARADETAARFTTTVNKKEYVFVMGPDGKARELATIRQGHVEDQAPRVSQVEWKASLASLQRRLASRLPSKGTEPALRAQVDGWMGVRGTYLPVPYKLSGTQREPETSQGFRQLLDQMGAFTGLRFVTVNQTGWDIFHVQFAQGTLEVAVAPLSPSGKFAGESYRLLGPALPEAQSP